MGYFVACIEAAIRYLIQNHWKNYISFRFLIEFQAFLFHQVYLISLVYILDIIEKLKRAG